MSSSAQNLEGEIGNLLRNLLDMSVPETLIHE